MHSFNPVYVAGAGRRRILSAQSAASSPQSPAVESPQATTSRGSTADDVMELHPGSPSPQLSPAQQPSPAQEPSPAQQPPQGPSARRPRQDPNRVLIEGFLNYLKQAEENRERRHNEVMAIYQEAVTAMKQVADVIVQQHQQQHPAPDDL
ncbi:bromodomain-containing protein 4-like [Dermacentor silvarum]|uniref:bromodomain-containing protein 4-like n=1 Tax=Dermacentor silvarum TaxID=543639 RepID=UPI00189AC85E|nr:bromodomain-containing protein 4-like [Dermacentor silvarum]